MQYDVRKDLAMVDTPESFDEIFFETHGVGDNPVTEREASIRHMIDPNEPTLQELRLCKNLIKGLHPVESYRKAFEIGPDRMSDKAVRSAVERLLRRPRVARKMYELREMLMEMEETDLMDVIHALNEDRKLARDLGQVSAAIQATKTKASILGLSNENKVTNNITLNLS